MANGRFFGDIGLFRLALLEAGFTRHSKDGQIFNDRSKVKPTRRLKLWFATEVFDASQAKQRKLEKSLRELFGDRILSMYFVKGYAPWAPQKSLCIRLQDEV